MNDQSAAVPCLDATPAKILAYYEGLKVDPTETLLCYYSGHGGTDPSRGQGENECDRGGLTAVCVVCSHGSLLGWSPVKTVAPSAFPDFGRPALRSRVARPAMMARRCASLSEPQRAISSSVRPQPRQRRDAVSISQILIQGVESAIGFYEWIVDDDQRLVANQQWLWLYAANIPPAMTNNWPLSSNWVRLSHFWSLAVEEHFYLVWPAVVFLYSRKTLMKICAALCDP